MLKRIVHFSVENFDFLRHVANINVDLFNEVLVFSPNSFIYQAWRTEFQEVFVWFLVRTPIENPYFIRTCLVLSQFCRVMLTCDEKLDSSAFLASSFGTNLTYKWHQQSRISFSTRKDLNKMLFWVKAFGDFNVHPVGKKSAFCALSGNYNDTPDTIIENDFLRCHIIKLDN